MEKIRNNKYVSKDVCDQVHMRADERLKRIDKNLDPIWRRPDGPYVQEEDDDK